MPFDTFYPAADPENQDWLDRTNIVFRVITIIAFFGGLVVLAAIIAVGTTPLLFIAIPRHVIVWREEQRSKRERRQEIMGSKVVRRNWWE